MSNFTEMFAKMSEFEQRLENNEPISESEMSEYLNWKQVRNPLPQRRRDGLAPSTTIILRKGEVL